MLWQVIYQLFFFLGGTLCDFEFAIAYFARKVANSYQIFSLFWDVATTLEGTSDLKVIKVASDRASPNLTFYRLDHHLQLDQVPDSLKKVHKVFFQQSNFFQCP